MGKIMNLKETMDKARKAWEQPRFTCLKKDTMIENIDCAQEEMVAVHHDYPRDIYSIWQEYGYAKPNSLKPFQAHQTK